MPIDLTDHTGEDQGEGREERGSPRVARLTFAPRRAQYNMAFYVIVFSAGKVRPRL